MPFGARVVEVGMGAVRTLEANGFQRTGKPGLAGLVLLLLVADAPPRPVVARAAEPRLEVLAAPEAGDFPLVKRAAVELRVPVVAGLAALTYT